MMATHHPPSPPAGSAQGAHASPIGAPMPASQEQQLSPALVSALQLVADGIAASNPQVAEFLRKFKSQSIQCAQLGLAPGGASGPDSSSSVASSSIRDSELFGDDASDSKFDFVSGRANKAPVIVDTTMWPVWQYTFGNFLDGFRARYLLTEGPSHIVLPTDWKDLNPREKKAHVAGLTLRAGNLATSHEQAVAEYKKCVFAYQSLLLATQNLPLASTIVMAVASPNVFVAWQRLEDTFQPQTKQKRRLLQHELDQLVQRRDEDINSFGIRAQPGATVVGHRFVLVSKRDGDGNEVGKKVRLTAQGFSQVPGRDYDRTYSGTVSMVAVRVLLAVAAILGLCAGHLDFATAYLNAPLDRPIYMRAPEGLRSAKRGQFMRLQRALYGLHQSGRLWGDVLAAQLKKQGWVPLLHLDPYVYVKWMPDGHMMIFAIYVDDVLYLHNPLDAAAMRAEIDRLKSAFPLRDLGPVHTLLGMRVRRDPEAGWLLLDQQASTEQLLKMFGYEKAKPSRTPEQKVNSTQNAEPQQPQEAPRTSHQPPASPSSSGVTVGTFRSLVGALQWLANGTRPDIAHAVNRMAREANKPTAEGLALGRRILRYLRGTAEKGLRYHRASTEGADSVPVLEAYSDSDWAGDASDSRSVSGVLLKLGGAAIAWQSKKQSHVALSSTEAEYVAASECGRVVAWLRALLAGIDCAQAAGTPLHIDNRTAESMLTDEGQMFARRRHIRVKYHHVRELCSEGLLVPRWIPTTEQQADIFTKALGIVPFEELRAKVMGEA